MAVLPAAPADWDGAAEVFERVGQGMPRLTRVRADSDYRAEALAGWVAAHARWALDVVPKRPGQATFEVPKWRWVVERTFGWLHRDRRLLVRHEYYSHLYDGSVDPACAIIAIGRL